MSRCRPRSYNFHYSENLLTFIAVSIVILEWMELRVSSDFSGEHEEGSVADQDEKVGVEVGHGLDVR